MRSKATRVFMYLTFLGVTANAAAALADGKVGGVWSDGGRFFFTVSNANYKNCSKNRFVLSIGDRTRQSMVLLAKATGATVAVAGGNCVNDGDTATKILYLR